MQANRSIEHLPCVLSLSVPSTNGFIYIYAYEHTTIPFRFPSFIPFRLRFLFPVFHSIPLALRCVSHANAHLFFSAAALVAAVSFRALLNCFLSLSASHGVLLLLSSVAVCFVLVLLRFSHLCVHLFVVFTSHSLLSVVVVFLFF